MPQKIFFASSLLMTDYFIVVVMWSKARNKNDHRGPLIVSEAPTCTRWSIQDDTFRWLDPHFFIILWMCERQLHRLLDETSKEPQLATSCRQVTEAQQGRSKVTGDEPWSPGSDCPVHRCRRRSPAEPSPPSSLSPGDRCHPSAPRSPHEPAHGSTGKQQKL